MSSKFSIFNYSSNRFEEIICPTDATCEEICINFANQITINPLARLLFGLRVHQKSGIKWIPNVNTLDPNCKYEFRIRFFVPNPTITLRKLDPSSYKYLYSQIQYDLVHGTIEDIKYPKHKDSVLGLGAVMMCIDHIDKKYPADYLRTNYKKYLPKQLARNHPYFAKQKILMPLNEMLSKKYDIYYVLKIYIDSILKMAPNYTIETYDCEADCLPEDGVDQDFCPVKVQINLNHENQPGLWIFYQYRSEWIHIAALKDIYSINCDNDDIVELVLSGRPKPMCLRFKNKHLNTSDTASFVTCVAGYYRLSVKWMSDICIKYSTPTLEELKSQKCHGPIGADFSYARIKQVRNECGSYIIRQCEREYNCYWLDINRKGVHTETFLIQRKSDKWFLPELSHDNISKEFNMLSDLINSIETETDKFCIQPSEYDKPPNLLICAQEKPIRIKRLITDLEDNEIRTNGGRIFDFHSDLQLYINFHKKIENGKITEIPADWNLSGDRHLKVTVKICSSGDIGDFLKLSNNWSKMHAQELLKLHGVTLSSPLSMVMEYPQFGDLQQLLRKEKDSMPFACLTKAVDSLLRAVLYLQENNFIHTKIRCSNIFVTKFDPKLNLLISKLGDPGLSNYYGIEDFPWIPIEFDGKLEEAKSDRTTQHWAFATTLWEIFNKGISLTGEPPETFKDNYSKSGLILPVDDDLPMEIRTIISDGWSPPEKIGERFKTHLIFSRLSQIRDYQLTICDHSSMSSSTSIWTVSESCNASQNNGTCSLSHTSSTCSLNDSGSLFTDDYDISCTKYKQLSNENTEIIRSIQPRNYVHQLKFGKLIVGEVIGEGHYGSVRKGKIEFNDPYKQPCQVAIKTLKNTCSISPSEFKDFKQEIEIMKQLKHKNIVKIISNIYKPEISIIMEYIECNSFTVYLKSEKNLPDLKLLKIALDVAEGMRYLRSMNIIHRDLAARNILIDNNCAKISDFGLARVADSSGLYKVQTMGREIPVKWYSPETIETNTFSFDSDVWSFGITLFEMFSRGEQPLLVPGIEIPPSDLLIRLNRGERLKKPKTCPVGIYHELLLPCWHQDPKNRPDFDLIITKITRIINSGECYHQMN